MPVVYQLTDHQRQKACHDYFGGRCTANSFSFAYSFNFAQMDQSLEPIVVPHLDRVNGLAEAQGHMRMCAQGSSVADDHRGGMSTKQTRSDYEVDFEHGLED